MKLGNLDKYCGTGCNELTKTCNNIHISAMDQLKISRLKLVHALDSDFSPRISGLDFDSLQLKNLS